MQEHISAVHEGDKKFKCDKCDFASGRAKRLKQHIEIVHNCSHKCETCGECFSSNFKLNYHKESIHEGKKKYECDQCDKHYSLEEGLTQHMDRVHGGQKSYNCDLCHFTFASSQNLKKHNEACHQTKIYKCDHCEKQFFIGIVGE